MEGFLIELIRHGKVVGFYVSHTVTERIYVEIADDGEFNGMYGLIKSLLIKRDVTGDAADGKRIAFEIEFSGNRFFIGFNNAVFSVGMAVREVKDI